jgi:Skp family chaperone for outer membrane proteins
MKKYNATVAIIALLLSTINAQDDLGSVLKAAESKKEMPTVTTSRVSVESKPPALKFGFVDMNRLFTGYPATKRAEETLNAERAKAKSELDQRNEKLRDMMIKLKNLSGSARENLLEQVRAFDKDVSEFRTNREKILQDSFTKMRKKIIDELNIIIKEISDANELNVVYDTSGMSMGQVPVTVYTNGVLDITDACLEMAKSPVKNQKRNQNMTYENLDGE